MQYDKKTNYEIPYSKVMVQSSYRVFSKQYLLKKMHMNKIIGVQSCDMAASTSESSGREQEIFVSENSCQ